MARLTNSEIEAHKTKQTIRFYLAGGSRSIFVSRRILSAVLVVCGLVT